MSSMSPQVLKCPKCGKKQETILWDSINVTLDPDLKKKLYAGEINMFECKKCGEKAFVNSPLLYHDMTLKFCVQYYPPQSLGEADFFKQFNADGSLVGMPLGLGAYIAKPQIVFDMGEMIRHVAFRDGIATHRQEVTRM